MIYFTFQLFLLFYIKAKLSYHMNVNKKPMSTLKYALIQVPIFSLTVTIYGLSLSILSDTRTSASIASSQFVGDGVTLYGIYCGIIVLGAFHLFCYVPFFIFSVVIQNWTIFFVGLGILNLLFNLISEALFFKFSSCFNFPSNVIVIARSCMVIILMTFFIVLSLFSIFYSIFKLIRKDSFISNDSEVNSFKEKPCWTILVSPLVIMPSIVILVLNAVLISRLKPQLNHKIEPSQIKMGFFNSMEIALIQSENYSKTNTYNQQLIGNLGDVLFSTNTIFAYRQCTGRKRQSCTYYYWHIYLYQIQCTNQSSLFYKDCLNSVSLTIEADYLDSGPYPSYNCYVNTVNDTCASTCTQLLSSYSLILIQDFNNQVQTAWTGLSNCNSQPNVNLIFDSRINPCSNAIKLDGGIFLFLTLFILTI